MDYFSIVLRSAATGYTVRLSGVDIQYNGALFKLKEVTYERSA